MQANSSDSTTSNNDTAATKAPNFLDHMSTVIHKLNEAKDPQAFRQEKEQVYNIMKLLVFNSDANTLQHLLSEVYY